MSIQTVREQIAALAKETKALVEGNKEAWTADNETTYQNNVAKIDELKAKISRMETIMQMDSDDGINDVIINSAGRKSSGKEAAKIAELHNKWLRGGDKAMSNEDWQTIRATMSTTTDSEGGYTVPKEIAKQLIDKLKDFGGLRKVANVIQTDSGVDISFPTTDGTAEEGEIVAENTTANDADPVFGTVLLKAYKFSSKVVTAPYELLQDSSIDLESFINGRLAKRIAAITNKIFTIGTGTGQSFGLFVAAVVGKVGAAGQVTTVTTDDLIDLVHSVDPAYRESGNCGFMMNDATFKVVRKLKDTGGRPIFIPGFDGLGKAMPDSILGYPVTLNSHAPVPAANAKSIAFGDLKAYTIRDVTSSVLLQRYTDSQYAKKGQVGFHQWSRHGGALLDNAAVKLYQHPAA